MANIYALLGKVQTELKAPKNQYNSFGKYNYRSAEDIVEAAKPLCIANGLVLTLSDEVVEIGGRIYVKATASVYTTDVEDQRVHSVSAFAREPDAKKGMDESQITGAASSYARKYALNGLFAIDDTKDADTMPPDNNIYCADCKKPIQGDGKLTAQGIADRSKSKLGRCLCLECAKKAAGQ